MLGIDADPGYIDDLEQAAVDAVEEYHDVYGEDIPITYTGELELVGDVSDASYPEVEDAVDEVAGFYDELLEVDSEDMREDLKERMKYDFSVLDSVGYFMEGTRGKLMAGWAAYMTVSGAMSGLAAASINAALASGVVVWMAQIANNGSYNLSSGNMKIGKEKKSFSSAYRTLSAELFHAFQDGFDSETIEGTYLREGAERATHIQALGDYAERHGDDGFQQLYDAARTDVLVRGVSQLKKYAEDSMFQRFVLSVGEDGLEDVLTGDEATTYRSPVTGRCGSWQYDIGAAAIIHADQESDDNVFQQVFHDDYSTLPDWLDPDSLWDRVRG